MRGRGKEELRGALMGGPKILIGGILAILYSAVAYLIQGSGTVHSVVTVLKS